jgi:hypothetical protein
MVERRPLRIPKIALKMVSEAAEVQFQPSE